MKPARLLQAGGLAGLVALVLNAVGQVSAFGGDALVNDPVPNLVAYYTSHGQQMERAVVIIAAAVFFLIWFMGAIHQLLTASPDPGNPFPAVVLISGALATSMLLLERIPQLVLALMAGQPGGLSADLTVRALADLQGVLTAGFVTALAVLTPALAGGLVRRGVAGAWVAWLGGISSALFLVSAFAIFTTIDSETVDNLLHLADLGAYVIVVVAAVALIRQPGRETAPAPSSVPAIAPSR